MSVSGNLTCGEGMIGGELWGRQRGDMVAYSYQVDVTTC